MTAPRSPDHAHTGSSRAIRIADVSRTFPNGIVAIDRLSLEFAAGSFVAIIGPSGCGKSTLLRLLAGLDAPTSGTIEGVDCRRIAYVFQDAHLLPWRNVLRNVALPLELAGIAAAERKRRATDALAGVGLADAARLYPAELSGGMRMRVSLARALVSDPQLLLLDEPFAALDEITRQHLDETLRDLWLRTKLTVLFVTHSITEATFLADRAIIFSRRPARIVFDAAIDLPRERTNELRTTAEFAKHQHRLFSALERSEAAR